MNPFIQADSTYLSFTSLLQATVSSANSATPSCSSSSLPQSHLSLLSPDTLYGSISHFLSHLDSQHIAHLTTAISTSQGLWNLPLPQPSTSNSTSTSSTTTTTPPPPIDLLQRSKEITNCVAYSVTKRVDLIISSRNGSTNWTTRRNLTFWLNQITSSIGSTSSDFLLISKLSILTGLLQGLQSVRATRKKNNGLGLNVKYQVRLIEDEWLVAFAECLEMIHAIYKGEELKSEDGDEWEREFKKMTLKNGAAGEESSGSEKGEMREESE